MKTDMLWVLITFYPSQPQADAVNTDLPLIRTLVTGASPSFQRQLIQREGAIHDISYPDWVAVMAQRMARSGLSIILSLADTPEDFAAVPDNIGPVVTACRRQMFEMVPRRHGSGQRRRDLSHKLLAVSLDREWEATYRDGRPKYCYGGAGGYARVARAAVSACHEVGIPCIGPGGTHSDDKTLPDVLEAMGDVRFDHPSCHWYSDSGWEQSVRRLDDLVRTFRRYGYGQRLWIGEYGVTGERDWGDDDHAGTAVERHERRFGRGKAVLDQHPDIEAAAIFQITEPPNAIPEDPHGDGGWGMFTHDWRPKPACQYFRARGDREGRG